MVSLIYYVQHMDAWTLFFRKIVLSGVAHKQLKHNIYLKSYNLNYNDCVVAFSSIACGLTCYFESSLL